MVDLSFIDELTRRISAAMPPGAHTLKQDLEKSVRAILLSGFEKLDLVTRQEFEVQTEVLARTRAKLSDLEKQIAELEARLPKRQ